MNHPTQNGFLNGGEAAEQSEAERTLRLIARIPAPEGLEDRVQAGVRGREMDGARKGRVLAWPALRPASGWMRTAAAAAIVFVVAGGGWGVYSRVQVPQSAKVIVMPRVVSGGGFSNAGAMRRPNTLNGPIVAIPVANAAATPAAVNAVQPKAPVPIAKKPVRRARAVTSTQVAAAPAQK
jgi:hypothetical protein